MSCESADHRVIRALGPSEVGMLPLVSEKSFTIVYNLTLSTTKPVTDEILRKCLQEWRDNYPMLRMMIREIEGTMYFCEDQSGAIDYERVQDDWLEVFNCMLDIPFSESGPLWRVKLVEGGKKESAFLSTMLVSWCHVITDGTSNIIMCNGLMEILNALLDGRKFETREKVKVYQPLEDILPQKEYLWSEIVDVLKEYLALTSRTALWSRVFPVNCDQLAKTKHVELGHLNEEETARLVAKCKEEGVTVHGALLTAINVAFHSVYSKNQWTQNNVTDDKMTLVSAIAANLRRCYETRDVFGYHVSGVGILVETSSDTSSAFWKSTKVASKLLREKLKAEDMARNVLTINQLHDGREHVAAMKENPKFLFDYGVSNMRDIKSMLPGVYKHVEVTWLARATSLQYYGFPMAFSATTFRGKFLFSVDYVTNLANEDMVGFLGKEIFSCLRDNLELLTV